MNRLRIAAIAVLIAAAGGGAAAWLLPQGNEMGALYLKAARYSAASSYYHRRYQRGDRSAEVIASLAWLYQLEARVGRSITLYEAYANRHPGDREARRRLEWFYKETRRTYDYARAIKQRIGTEEHPDDQLRLARLYWRMGRYRDWAGQMAGLAQLNKLRPMDAYHYGQYLARTGKQAEAFDILDRFVFTAGKTDINEQIAERSVLVGVSLLLDLKQPKKALATATRMLAKYPWPALRLQLVDLFEGRKHAEFALALLNTAAGGKNIDRTRLRRLTWLEYSSRRFDVSFRRLERLAQRGKLHPGDMDLLILTARAAKKLGSAWAAVAGATKGAVDDAAAVPMLDAALDSEDAALAARIMKRQGSGFAKRNPLIAARLAILQGKVREAASLTLSAAHRSIPAELGYKVAKGLHRAGNGAVARRVVEKILAGPVPAGRPVLEVAGFAVGIGMRDAGRRWIGGAGKDRAASTWVQLARLLTDGPESRPALERILAGQADLSERFSTLQAFKFAATEAGRMKLAGFAIKAMALERPGSRDKLVLDQIYTVYDKPLAKLAALKPYLGKSVALDEQYAIALAEAVRTKADVTAELRAFLPRWLARRDVSFKRRRVIIDDLIALKKGKLVAAILKRGGAASTPAQQELLVIALVGAGKQDDARDVVVKLIAGARPGPALARYATLAEETGDLEAAKGAYRRVLRARPGDLQTMKRLAVVSNWSEEPDEARSLLTKYLARRPADWDALHILGEVINRHPDWRQAARPYRRALAIINGLRNPPPKAQRTRAHILYRLGRFKASVQAFEAILRRAPGDKETRDQYIDVLIALGRYREADRVKNRAPSRSRSRSVGEAAQ